MKCICNTSAIHLCASVYQIHCAIHLQYILDCNTLCNTFVIHGDAFVFSQIYSKMPTGSRLMCNTMCTSTCDTLVLYNCAIHCVPLPVILLYWTIVQLIVFLYLFDALWYSCVVRLCNTLSYLLSFYRARNNVLNNSILFCLNHSFLFYLNQSILFWEICRLQEMLCEARGICQPLHTLDPLWLLHIVYCTVLIATHCAM